jgi:hypothetical protein
MRSEIMRFVVVVLAAAGILATPKRADAGFMTQTLEYTYYFPDTASPFDSSTFVVSNAVERSSLASGNAGSDFATLDVSDTAILVDFYNGSSFTPSTFNGFVLSDINSTVPAITGVTVNSATNMSGFDASRVSFSADKIFVNLEGLSFDANTIVQLDVTFVPLPPTLLAGFLGMGVLAGVRRFRRA